MWRAGFTSTQDFILSYMVDTRRSLRCVYLPNVGRNGHTIVHHIVARWTTLAEVTVFTMASIASGQWNHLLCRKLTAVLDRLPNLEGFYTMAGEEPGLTLPFDPSFAIRSWRASSQSRVSAQVPLVPAQVRPRRRQRARSDERVGDGARELKAATVRLETTQLSERVGVQQ